MQTARQKATQDQVIQRIQVCEFNKHDIEEYLYCDIEEMDACERHSVDEDGADGVEEDLEGAEKGFSEERVEEYGFEGGGEVGVETVDAEGFVVC
jgi:hypothetical protein